MNINFTDTMRPSLVCLFPFQCSNKKKNLIQHNVFCCAYFAMFDILYIVIADNHHEEGS